MTTVDIIVLLLIGGGIVLGALKGFVTEVLSLFAWVAAIFALKLLHAPVTERLDHLVGTHGGAAVLAFALVFGVVFILGRLVAVALGRRTRQSILGPADRLLGAGFGAVKGLLIATLLFLAANLMLDMWSGQSAPRPVWLRNARTYPLLSASGHAIVDFVRLRRGEAPANDGRVRAGNAQGHGAV